MDFSELKQRQAAMWGAAPFETLAATLTSMYAVVIDSVAAGPGDQWLDVACGTGDLARAASRTGADILGADLSPALVDTARRLSEGLDVRFEVADCEALPYDDASYDIVTSSVGAIFAPDHRAVARELARVTRSGGRLALTAWTRDSQVSDLFDVLAEYAPPPPPEAGESIDWGDEEYVRELLGPSFELTITRHNAPWRSESAERMLAEMTAGLGPLKTLLEMLPEDRATSLRRDLVEEFDHYRTGDTEVTVDRHYHLVAGICR